MNPNYHSPEEAKVNELAAATGADLEDCRRALERNDFDFRRSERELSEKQLDRICRRSTDTSGKEFARRMMNKPLGQVTDAGLKFLTLAAASQNQG